jgi:hypothetical protein
LFWVWPCKALLFLSSTSLALRGLKTWPSQARAFLLLTQPKVGASIQTLPAGMLWKIDLVDGAYTAKIHISGFDNALGLAVSPADELFGSKLLLSLIIFQEL